MEINQEIVLTLFKKETMKAVGRLYKSNKDRTPIESSNITFRLFKPSDYNINLEVLITMKIEGSEKEVDLGAMGKGKEFETISYFKPVGYYTISKKKLFSNVFEITLLGEYEEAYSILKEKDLIDLNIKTNTLTLMENAAIAAFSKEARIEAFKNKESFSFTANGLILDIYMSNEGYPEVFLDDKYGLKGAIAKYKLYDKPASLKPIINYKEIFDKFHKMSLFTAWGKDILI
jgi:hypothetical protein